MYFLGTFGVGELQEMWLLHMITGRRRINTGHNMKLPLGHLEPRSGSRIDTFNFGWYNYARMLGRNSVWGSNSKPQAIIGDAYPTSSEAKVCLFQFQVTMHKYIYIYIRGFVVWRTMHNQFAATHLYKKEGVARKKEGGLQFYL